MAGRCSLQKLCGFPSPLWSCGLLHTLFQGIFDVKAFENTFLELGTSKIQLCERYVPGGGRGDRAGNSLKTPGIDYPSKSELKYRQLKIVTCSRDMWRGRSRLVWLNGLLGDPAHNSLAFVPSSSLTVPEKHPTLTFNRISQRGKSLLQELVPPLYG